MRISAIIFLGFFIILVLFSSTTFLNYKESENILVGAEKFEKSAMIVRNSHRFQRNFLNMVGGLRAYLVTEDSLFLRNYDSARIENAEIIRELNLLVSMQAEQMSLLQEIRDLQKYWVDEFARPLLNAKERLNKNDFSQLYASKIRTGLEKGIQRSLQLKFSEFTNYEYGSRELERKTLASSLYSTRRVSFVLTVISILLGATIAMLIARLISSRISNLVKMTKAIAAGNYSLRLPDDRSELGHIARELNTMADIIDTNISHLERQRNDLEHFAHIISHEMKVPLQGIDNVLTWIEEDHSNTLSAEIQDYHRIIRDRSMKAQNVLKGILLYARAGFGESKKERVNVNEMLQEIRNSIDDKNGIVLQVAPVLPTFITERVPLQQVFTNLVVNAVKHHDKNNGIVKVYHQEEGDCYQFFVEDDGPGISKIYHEKIFAIFQTLNDRTGSDHLGIGLAIVKKILDDRQLDINIFSAPGGSIFSFTWPKN